MKDDELRELEPLLNMYINVTAVYSQSSYVCFCLYLDLCRS